jgi:hypothetical protein
MRAVPESSKQTALTDIGPDTVSPVAAGRVPSSAHVRR